MQGNRPVVDEAHRIDAGRLDPPERLLMGPGPSNPPTRVLQALGFHEVGHLDPAFIQIMKETQELLRYAWQTDNQLTIPVSGTGSAAMEAAIANMLEPGDIALIGVNGYFGERLCEMASRYGADVRRIDAPWGEAFDPLEVAAALEEHQPTLFALVHAETSTGALQPLKGIGKLCREFDCLFLLDTVTSLGGVPLFLDRRHVDIAYSGSQKCLSCPPGVAPLTLGERALKKLHSRRSKVANWYLDMTLLGKYWGEERTYHHTAPVNMIYGLREALRVVAEEGLEARWERHREAAEMLWAGLSNLGIECHVPHERRCPTLTTALVPEGIDADAMRRFLLDRYNIEIGGCFGPLAGKAWRIGLMGHNARRERVALLLTALDAGLSRLRRRGGLEG